MAIEVTPNSLNERIVNSVYKAMRGELPVPRVESGWCLRSTRIILEDALGWADQAMFERFPYKVESDTPEPRAFWSRDVQRSFRDEGWGIPLSEAAPGDILMYWQAAKNSHGDYVGHVAILAFPGFVFENIAPQYREGRGAFNSGALSLTPLEGWGIGDIECFRIPDSEAAERYREV